MKTLFARIFLYFWLAMGLIVAGTTVVATTFVWNRTAALQRLVPSELAQEAEQSLQSGGIPALKKWVSDIEDRHRGLDVFVVDARGQAISQRSVPDFMKRRIAAMTREGYFNGPAKRSGRVPSDPLRSMPQITATNGMVYTILFSQAPFFSPSVLGTPGIQALLLFIALSTSGSISWYLARTVTRPVERLQASARALANGDLNARVGHEFVTRKDELAVLAHDFDQMADRLRQLIDSKEVLLRDVSHELRTPLARLRLALGLARRPNADLERELDRIEREAERLDELIGEILRLARLNSSQPGVHFETFDLAGLLHEITDDARMEAQAQNKQVLFDCNHEVAMQGDPELLRSAVENVVRNAVRYTREHTSVEITLREDPGLVCISVRDHGPGVPEAELQRLFEPFYRVSDQARQRDTGGYGVGLAITARVLGLHHGTVLARNHEQGGLVVELTLPGVRSDTHAKT